MIPEKSWTATAIVLVPFTERPAQQRVALLLGQRHGQARFPALSVESPCDAPQDLSPGGSRSHLPQSHDLERVHRKLPRVPGCVHVAELDG